MGQGILYVIKTRKCYGVRFFFNNLSSKDGLWMGSLRRTGLSSSLLEAEESDFTLDACGGGELALLL